MNLYRMASPQIPMAVRMRVDVPDPSWRPPFAEHAYLRRTTVGGVQWSYCIRHRGWESADG